jgi:hypothetical protein
MNAEARAAARDADSHGSLREAARLLAQAAGILV